MTADRVGALWTGGGISILLTRASIILFGSRRVLRQWVIGLAGVEFVLDLATLLTSIRWGVTNLRRHRSLPLRLAAAATLLHAARVGVFVLGRLRPFKDFDVRPEHRSSHDQRWNWRQVTFAVVMSLLGVVGVFVVRMRIHQRSSTL
ncbi:MAG: hypothetical protein ACN4GZ_06895 [Acidimicrobiales bacterium]